MTVANQFNFYKGIFAKLPEKIEHQCKQRHLLTRIVRNDLRLKQMPKLWNSGSQPRVCAVLQPDQIFWGDKNFWGGKMFDFRRATAFFLGRRFSKH